VDLEEGVLPQDLYFKNIKKKKILTTLALVFVILHRDMNDRQRNRIFSLYSANKRVKELPEKGPGKIAAID
jgi:hypothetical protein